MLLPKVVDRGFVEGVAMLVSSEDNLDEMFEGDTLSFLFLGPNELSVLGVVAVGVPSFEISESSTSSGCSEGISIWVML